MRSRRDREPCFLSLFEQLRNLHIVQGSPLLSVFLLMLSLCGGSRSGPCAICPECFPLIAVTHGAIESGACVRPSLAIPAEWIVVSDCIEEASFC